jgi:hypothetical protein
MIEQETTVERPGFEIAIDRDELGEQWRENVGEPENDVVLGFVDLTEIEEAAAIKGANGVLQVALIEMAKLTLRTVDGRTLHIGRFENVQIWEWLGPKVRQMCVDAVVGNRSPSPEATLHAKASFARTTFTERDGVTIGTRHGFEIRVLASEMPEDFLVKYGSCMEHEGDPPHTLSFFRFGLGDSTAEQELESIKGVEGQSFLIFNEMTKASLIELGGKPCSGREVWGLIGSKARDLLMNAFAENHFPSEEGKKKATKSFRKTRIQLRRPGA